MPANAGFVQQQSQNEWRGSKLIGANVYGPDNKSIGEINDVIVASDGQIKAAVVGVGGFLGVGQKDVAVPFNSLAIDARSGLERDRQDHRELHQGSAQERAEIRLLPSVRFADHRLRHDRRQEHDADGQRLSQKK